MSDGDGEEDLIGTASDPYKHPETPEEKAFREAQDRVERNKQVDDMRVVMSTQAGRRFMWRLLARTGIARTPFRGENRSLTDFCCGEQNIGLFIQDELLAASVERFIDMEKENRK